MDVPGALEMAAQPRTSSGALASWQDVMDAARALAAELRRRGELLDELCDGCEAADRYEDALRFPELREPYEKWRGPR